MTAGMVSLDGTEGDAMDKLASNFIGGKLILAHDPGGNMAKAFARGVYFYEDLEKDFPNPNLGLKEMPDLVKYSGTDSDLAEGHSRGGFKLTFDKPVLKMMDVYTCIGCGAPGKKGEPTAEELNRDIPGYGFQYDVDYSDGGGLDKFTGQYIVGKDNKPFTEAYGYIPTGGTIRWRTKGGGAKIKLQKVPGHDDFDKMDWTPPPGSGGDTEIPFTDPDVGVDPTKDPDGPMPEPDFVPDMDPGGPGEPEITPLEPDTTIDPDFPDDEPDFTEPEIPEPEITPSEPDP
ncbi:15167_t:CDS:2, partial [Funneliformis geosporum]